MPDLLVICATTDVMDARLNEAFEPVFMNDLDDPVAWLDAKGAGIRYVLTDGHLGVAPQILKALSDLALISSYGVGYDAIDTEATNARGVPVTHTPGVLDEEVATTALMLCLSCWREFESSLTLARSGRWGEGARLSLPHTADNRRIGILGLGRIGKAFARKVAPFSPEIHYHGRNRQDVPFIYHATLHDMAEACDTLVSFAPGGTDTNKLINSQVINVIGPEGYLINVGRGTVVDEDALISALAEGRLKSAGLDVFRNEPYIPDGLRALPNVVLTPHIGSATVETRRAMGDLAIDNLIAHKSGKPLLTPVPESQGLL